MFTSIQLLTTTIVYQYTISKPHYTSLTLHSPSAPTDPHPNVCNAAWYFYQGSKPNFNPDSKPNLQQGTEPNQDQISKPLSQYGSLCLSSNGSQSSFYHGCNINIMIIHIQMSILMLLLLTRLPNLISTQVSKPNLQHGTKPNLDQVSKPLSQHGSLCLSSSGSQSSFHHGYCK